MKRYRLYSEAHEASVVRAMEAEREMPRGLRGLLAWFEGHWGAETPSRLHVHDVERESALGSPRLSDPFRRYLMNSSFETDADGHYVRPMHAALAALTGRDPNAERAYHGRFLFALACNGFDWRAVGMRAMLPLPVQAPYTEYVLGLLWRRYRVEPERLAAVR